MPKERERILTIADVATLYDWPSEMPWERIETACGKPFNAAERREIHECTEAYSGEACLYARGAPRAHSDKVRQELLKSARDFTQLVDRLLPGPERSIYDDNGLVSDDVNALRALSWTYSDDDFWLREELHEARARADRIVRLLETDVPDAPEVSAEKPELKGLEAFIYAVLGGASSKPARSKQPSSFEHERWGVAVGPSSTHFRAFVNAVLQSSFSQDQMRDAYRAVRRKGQGG